MSARSVKLRIILVSNVYFTLATVQQLRDVIRSYSRQVTRRSKYQSWLEVGEVLGDFVDVDGVCTRACVLCCDFGPPELDGRVANVILPNNNGVAN